MSSHPLHVILENLTADPTVRAAIANDPRRCTGRSFIQAMKYVAQALSLPRKRIFVQDHYGTEEADKALVHAMQRIVVRLELEGIKFGKTIGGHYIVFGEDIK
jgi:hypothetical protein